MTSSGDAPGVADVLVVISSTDRRGAEIEGVALATELSGRGLPAAVVALAPGATSAPLDVETLGASPLGPSTLRELRRLSRTAGAVVAYGSKTLPACAIALAGSDVPFVYRSIGDPAAWAGGRTRRARTAALLRRAAQVVVLSDRAAGTVHDLYRIDRTAISVAPNARDATRYAPIDASQRLAARVALGLDPRQRVVSVIGALTPEKRVDLAIEAAARLTDVVLVVAGGGPGRAPLEEAARRRPGTVRALGVLPDVRWLLHASDVVLSTSSTEGMPGSLIEAALCGVALVATDAGFAADLVGPGGVVVPVDAGPAQVADAVRSALAESSGLGAQARCHAVARFSWDAVAPAWLQLLADVSGRPRAVAQYGGRE
jgi:glycosyltransferase involved in cell wall biosynthesis